MYSYIVSCNGYPDKKHEVRVYNFYNEFVISSIVWAAVVTLFYIVSIYLEKHCTRLCDYIDALVIFSLHFEHYTMNWSHFDIWLKKSFWITLFLQPLHFYTIEYFNNKYIWINRIYNGSEVHDILISIHSHKCNLGI